MQDKTQIWSDGDFSYELVPANLRITRITFERAKMLAETRRNRINLFAVGGLIAVIPGTAQSIADYYADPTKMPQAGHMAEIVMAIVFTTLTVASVCHVGQPTSTTLLKELFPETAKNTGFLNWVKSLFRAKRFEVG